MMRSGKSCAGSGCGSMSDRPVMAAGGPVKVDPHPRDTPTGLYEGPGPRSDYGPEAADGAAWDRAKYSTGSPHVLRRVTCGGCQRTGTYYGRQDLAPDPATFRCDRCAPVQPDDAA